MPRTTMRAKYDPQEEAEKVMSQLPPDKLRDKEFVWMKLSDAKVKGITKMGAGRIRNRLLKENAGYSNGEVQPVDSLDAVNTVVKILPKVGGLAGLERAIAFIRSVKGKV